jgi:hypothetical protein
MSIVRPLSHATGCIPFLWFPRNRQGFLAEITITGEVGHERPGCFPFYPQCCRFSRRHYRRGSAMMNGNHGRLVHWLLPPAPHAVSDEASHAGLREGHISNEEATASSYRRQDADLALESDTELVAIGDRVDDAGSKGAGTNANHCANKWESEQQPEAGAHCEARGQTDRGDRHDFLPAWIANKREAGQLVPRRSGSHHRLVGLIRSCLRIALCMVRRPLVTVEEASGSKPWTRPRDQDRLLASLACDCRHSQYGLPQGS